MFDRPAKPVVIYDGGCNICAGNLKWLYRLDTLKKFEALPYQTERLTEIFPALKIEECQKSMHLVFPNGKIYTGSDAFCQIFLRMPLMFPVGLVMWLPPVAWLLRRLYPILARNRYRIGGACPLPDK
jgi:predicted DCC family thiol-disulfide oxidoreductase YuxK